MDEVKAKLGRPVTEFIDESGDGALNYPGWQIGFGDGRLTYRIHDLESGQINRGDGDRLRRQISELRRGMSIAEVEAALGNPDSSELYYGNGGPPEKVFRYGPWELRFQGERLVLRTHW